MTLIPDSQNKNPNASSNEGVISDPAIILRVEIMCGLFELAYELKSLELKRRNPDVPDDWIKSETLKLIEAGTK